MRELTPVMYDNLGNQWLKNYMILLTSYRVWQFGKWNNKNHVRTYTCHFERKQEYNRESQAANAKDTAK